MKKSSIIVMYHRTNIKEELTTVLGGESIKFSENESEVVIDDGDAENKKQ